MASRASRTVGDVTTDQSGNVTPGRTAWLGSGAAVDAAALFRDEEDTQQSFMASRLPCESLFRSPQLLPGDDGGPTRRDRCTRPSAEAPPAPHLPATRSGQPRAGLRRGAAPHNT